MDSKVKIFCMSDLHISVKKNQHGELQVNNRKKNRMYSAFEKAKDGSLILIAGDLAESGLKEEYDALEHILEEKASVPVLPTMGNHDSMGKKTEEDVTFPYQVFQNKCMVRNKRDITVKEQVEDGTYAVQKNDDIHILSLNLEKKGNQFIMSKGLIDWMRQYMKKQRVSNPDCVFLVLCHPPLIDRSFLKEKRKPYINREEALCKMIDEIGNCIWISGHTHICPHLLEGEPFYDEEHRNLFLNTGSVCINDLLGNKDMDCRYKDGNIVELEMTKEEIVVNIIMLHGDRIKTLTYERR